MTEVWVCRPHFQKHGNLGRNVKLINSLDVTLNILSMRSKAIVVLYRHSVEIL